MDSQTDETPSICSKEKRGKKKMCRLEEDAVYQPGSPKSKKIKIEIDSDGEEGGLGEEEEEEEEEDEEGEEIATAVNGSNSGEAVAESMIDIDESVYLSVKKELICENILEPQINIKVEEPDVEENGDDDDDDDINGDRTETNGNYDADAANLEESNRVFLTVKKEFATINEENGLKKLPKDDSSTNNNNMTIITNHHMHHSGVVVEQNMMYLGTPPDTPSPPFPLPPLPPPPYHHRPPPPPYPVQNHTLLLQLKAPIAGGGKPSDSTKLISIIVPAPPAPAPVPVTAPPLDPLEVDVAYQSSNSSLSPPMVIDADPLAVDPFAQEQEDNSDCSSLMEMEATFTNQELVDLPTRELNRRLRGLPDHLVRRLKMKRRTLKNRSYANNSRTKRSNRSNELEMQNKELLEKLGRFEMQLDQIRMERDFYKRQCYKLRGAVSPDKLAGMGESDPPTSLAQLLFHLPPHSPPPLKPLSPTPKSLERLPKSLPPLSSRKSPEVKSPSQQKSMEPLKGRLQSPSQQKSPEKLPQKSTELQSPSQQKSLERLQSPLQQKSPELLLAQSPSQQKSPEPLLERLQSQSQQKSLEKLPQKSTELQSPSLQKSPEPLQERLQSPSQQKSLVPLLAQSPSQQKSPEPLLERLQSPSQQKSPDQECQEKSPKPDRLQSLSQQKSTECLQSPSNQKSRSPSPESLPPSQSP